MADHPHVREFIADNYRQLREERGLTWEQLAQQFDRDGYDELAEWARSEGKRGDKSARANRGTERAVGERGTARG